MQMLDVWKKTCTRTCAPRLLDCFFVCGDIRLNNYGDTRLSKYGDTRRLDCPY